MVSAQPAIRVAVNDRQLPVAAVMEHGRVLVPFRAVVEALGGSVSAFRLPLPPPARIIAGRTFAPIRYLANALHAQIQYDGRAHLVQVFTSGTPVANAQPAPRGIPAINPAPESTVGTAYPTISASFSLPAGELIRSIRMLLDGRDVSYDAAFAGTYVTYIPRTGLPVGTHTVAISGTSTSGRTLDETWSFTTSRPAAPDVGGSEPYFEQALQLYVYASELTGGGDVSVQLTAPPNGEAFAFSCTSSYRFPLYAAPSSQFYSGTVRIRNVNSDIDCPITAMYVGWNGQVAYAPYPAFVHVHPQSTQPPSNSTPTPVPTPTPTRVPRPVPIHTRIPEPTPSPNPTPTPRVIKPFPHERATPEPTPEPTPTPSPTPRARRPLPIERITPPPNASF